MRPLVLALLALYLVATLTGCGGGGSSAQTGPPKWTILVYMNAANDLGSTNFGAKPDVTNIEQMQSVATNGQVNIVVQWKEISSEAGATFNSTRRYLIEPGGTSSVNSKLLEDLGSGIDMGAPQTLNDFIVWGKKNFPAERYALVLWDHGNGWRMTKLTSPHRYAFSYDGATNHAIQIWDLPTALSGQKFDMIVWDCSLMQMSEVAYELRSYTPYVVGSEESPPVLGFPYDLALARFRDNPSASTLSLAEGFVDGMITRYPSGVIEESVIDTSKLGLLSTGVDQFAAELTTNKTQLTPLTQQIRANAKSYDEATSPPRFYFDLFDVASRYHTGSSNINLQVITTNVMNAVNGAVAYQKAHNSVGSHGISIDFSPGSYFDPSVSQYDQMQWASANRWVLWLTVAP